MADPLVQPASLEGVTQQRERLHAAIVELESAAAAPATAHIEGWRAGMQQALSGLRAAFETHVAFTEAPGGLYDDILSVAPRLATAVGAVRDEHPAIAEALSQLQAVLAEPAAEPGPWVEQSRQQAMRALGMLVRHRQRGADLTYTAFDEELGGSG